MLRSILAVVLGYAAMMVSTMLVVYLLSVGFGVMSESEAAALPTAYVVANLAGGLACAMLGGFVAAWRAPRAPRMHAVVLACLVFILGVLYGLTAERGAQPTWYLALLPLLAAGGALLGGLIAPTGRTSRAT